MADFKLFVRFNSRIIANSFGVSEHDMVHINTNHSLTVIAQQFLLDAQLQVSKEVKEEIMKIVEIHEYQTSERKINKNELG